MTTTHVPNYLPITTGGMTRVLKGLGYEQIQWNSSDLDKTFETSASLTGDGAIVVSVWNYSYDDTATLLYSLDLKGYVVEMGEIHEHHLYDHTPYTIRLLKVWKRNPKADPQFIKGDVVEITNAQDLYHGYAAVVQLVDKGGDDIDDTLRLLVLEEDLLTDPLTATYQTVEVALIHRLEN